MTLEPGIDAILATVPLFAELTADDRARIAATARIANVAAGEMVIVEGSPPAEMLVVIEGELVVTKRGPGGPVVLNTCARGDLLGELSALADKPRTASVTARTPARVVVLPVGALHDLLRSSLGATLAILRTMAARLANTEAVARQHDTLAALGRIAAGLAHEFNNPAAAVKRGAVELEERLGAWEKLAYELRGVEVDADRRALIERLATPRSVFESALQRARRERALEDTLSARGIANAWEIAPALASLGWDDGVLGELLAAFPSPAIVMRWIEATASTRAVARDVATAATRISELVDAVRTHSHLGQAPMQITDVDIHAGLDGTLALLRHRLGSVTVKREYAPDLPRVPARGGALNQVWTNLVDNSLHAMGGSGELVLATRRDGDYVIVEVIDSGHGIPLALHSEIWKPFFTTKPVGEGTGLGLHLVYNVVVHEHRGRIEFDSRPGRTCFRVKLPIHEPVVVDHR